MGNFFLIECCNDLYTPKPVPIVQVQLAMQNAKNEYEKTAPKVNDKTLFASAKKLHRGFPSASNADNSHFQGDSAVASMVVLPGSQQNRIVVFSSSKPMQVIMLP